MPRVSSMPHRIAIATEGVSDKAVLETICRRAGHVAKAVSPGSGGRALLKRDFHKILGTLEVTFRPTHFVVVPDLHPELDCPREAEAWREEIRRRFRKAQLCLSIWEIEAWLLAEPTPVRHVLGFREFTHANPDQVGDPKPSRVLEELYRKKYGYRGAAYHKERDGEALAGHLDLDVAATHSPSLAHFLKVIGTRQTQLVT